MNKNKAQSYQKLKSYIESENFKGFDPYDTLLSKIPFKKYGKWAPVLAIQLQKRNPINIRRLIGVKKEINPKAFGLLLNAYSRLYQKKRDSHNLLKMEYLFNWLKENHSEGYDGYGWGYNFPWASSVKYLNSFVPSAVVTGFVCKGVYQYYLATEDTSAIEVIKNAKDFILNSLPRHKYSSGICISYTPVVKDICYNASLLAGEVLAMYYNLTQDENVKKLCIDIVNFVVSRQKDDGSWAYSEDENGNERIQLDFHQGYVVESIDSISKLIDFDEANWKDAIIKGLDFYKNVLFDNNGRSNWRYPKRYPIEIHNQSQGIITFSLLKEYRDNFEDFSNLIAKYTIENMQAKDGHFYYQKHRFLTNKISYMRWSQAWMFLALTMLSEDFR